MKLYLQRKIMEENRRPINTELEDLLALRGQLHREIELAGKKRIRTQQAVRKLAVLNKAIAKIRRGETKGDLFDRQLDLF